MQTGEGTTEGRRLPSPAMVLAVAALIAALAGTAVAVDKITSKDIAKNAVRSKHIKRGQVRAADTDITRSGFGSSLETGGDGTPLPELNITAPVKRGDAVSIRAFGSGSGGIDGCAFFLGLQGPGIPSDPRVLRFGSPNERRYIDGSSTGTTDFFAADPIDYLVPSNGKLRLRPQLAAQGAGGCSIRDRGVSITVHR